MVQLAPLAVRVDPKNQSVYSVEQVAGQSRRSNEMNIAGRVIMFDTKALANYKAIPVRDDKLLPLTKPGYQATVRQDSKTKAVLEITIRAKDPVTRADIQPPAEKAEKKRKPTKPSTDRSRPKKKPN